MILSLMLFLSIDPVPLLSVYFELYLLIRKYYGLFIRVSLYFISSAVLLENRPILLRDEEYLVFPKFF